MEYEIVRWYDERKTVARVQGFDSAVQEYNKTDVADTVQLYLKYNGMTILLAQKECQGRRDNLPNNTFSLPSHSCSIHILAWQLINKFSLKTRLNKLCCLVRYRGVRQSRSHSILICIFFSRNAFLLIYSVRDKILTNIKLQNYEYNYSRRTDWCI